MRGNSGRIVLIKTRENQKGRTFNKDGMINGKVPVYVMDDKFKLTGEKILCDPASLQSIGFAD